MARRSLGETFSLCQKAARGAGMAWGMADECGRAGRWLLRNHLPLSPLALLLESRATVGFANPDARPLSAASPGCLLCPLSAGALLRDESRRLIREGECGLKNTAHPILLAPFLAGVGAPVMLEWAGAKMILSGGDVWIAGGADGLLLESAPDVRVAVCGMDSIPSGWRAPDFMSADDDSWARLTRLAARILVPSGGESRARGAGAGLTDND